jgi:hypothetical protein
MYTPSYEGVLSCAPCLVSAKSAQFRKISEKIAKKSSPAFPLLYLVLKKETALWQK